MAVILNETVLRALLETREGPVGRDLERRAVNVTAAARLNAQGILARMTPAQAEQAIEYRIGNDAEGLFATIGVDPDQGSFSDYLARKEQREHVWLEPALEAAKL